LAALRNFRAPPLDLRRPKLPIRFANVNTPLKKTLHMDQVRCVRSCWLAILFSRVCPSFVRRCSDADTRDATGEYAGCTGSDSLWRCSGVVQLDVGSKHCHELAEGFCGCGPLINRLQQIHRQVDAPTGVCDIRRCSLSISGRLACR